jgi:hypothetical protein
MLDSSSFRRASIGLALVLVVFGMVRPLTSAPTPSSSAAGSNSFRDAVVRAVESHLQSIGIEERDRPVAEQLEMISPPLQVDGEFSVQNLHWDALRTALYFRMSCAPQKPCAPFLVRARVPVELAKLLLRRVHGAHEAMHPAGSGNTRGVNRCNQPSVLVRAGKPATLLLRRENMKLTTSVLALECGAAGQQVRARGTKTNKLFDAEVVGKNLLAATF